MCGDVLALDGRLSHQIKHSVIFVPGLAIKIIQIYFCPRFKHNQEGVWGGGVWGVCGGVGVCVGVCVCVCVGMVGYNVSCCG